ncbi:copper-binding protein [Aromatoleum evansii]|uniref:copper-binding protein n=1 Tax=Aromatoleum evansii TaxID=59406 RepID=UPI00145E1338|nr:copper-binding protein [Aromatoleum evansii]NMG29989.1 RND transporter [Aromatoleum evansii]
MLALRPLSALALVAALMSAAPVYAASEHGSHHNSTAVASSEVASALSDGTIKKVDKAAGKITINHGPLENLGMPAMTMAFIAHDAAMLEQVKAGDRVRFRAERVDGVFTVMKLEAAN